MKPTLSRRQVLQCACCLPLAAALAPLALPALAAPTKAHTTLTAEQALQRLIDGNQGFMDDQPLHGETNRDRRLAIAKGQTPFCVLVSCSDSRVSPELLFGRGLGELFIVRNAGNTLDTTALGSVEYAISQLGVPLIVVMGHEKCGAVEAAVAVVEQNALYPGAIGAMIEPILPAVLSARVGNPPDLLEAAVRSNVQRTVRRLRAASEPTLLAPQQKGQVKVVGAYYTLENGHVDFFDV
ncbi:MULTISPECIES: carbonic anhydrase [Pseudomonadaceae]|uniref:Carbonic anhydrase n=3 Tax=Pseudomonadaceae TaxID=135621 RepID=A0A1G5PDZ9_9PSED|nr:MULTISPECIES: carbonic anhydrase [Pseudomonas]MBH3329613.1 carbonic anhydrase [Pseudomonas oryzihabitans]MCI1008915.1 carbonic anhydrase [Pseudomonas oryzihabitans]NMY91535.1 carbonic anhydrase [Pseudomonas psychrotolerans]NMZ65494.1 carbonic anhydrase [Pseudomonas oryzihabitans]ONN71926.1 carbonic anhydrase [Pseudomonas psychrotolerans]